MPKRRYGHRYGSGHQDLRRRFLRRMARGELFNCWRCGELIDPSKPWDLGHVRDNTAVGGERWPEHRACNRATITNLRRKLAEAEALASDPTSSREW